MEKTKVYHGTSNGNFSKFNQKYLGINADSRGFGSYGCGFYFTKNKELAKSYALELHKRKNFMGRPYLYEVELTYHKIFDMRKWSKYDFALNQLQKKKNCNIFDLTEEDNEKAYQMAKTSPKEIAFIKEIISAADSWEIYDCTPWIKEKGYDLVITPYHEFIIFSEKQIKILEKIPLFPERKNKLARLEEILKSKKKSPNLKGCHDKRRK